MFKTLKELRQGARARADMLHDSAAIDDFEANDYVNEAWGELYDLITRCDNAKQFTVNATLPPQIGQFSYYLPTDFYRLVSCHVKRGSSYVPGIPADPSEYAELADNQGLLHQPKYFVRRNPSTGERYIFVFPKPDDDVAVTYWPLPAYLSLDSDSLDNPASWLEFVMVGAAIRMLDKVERDATALLLRKRELERRIEKAVDGSDFNSPKQIRDISYRYGFGRW